MPGSGCSSTKGSIGLSAGISTGMGGVSTPGGGGGGGGTSGGAGGTVCGAMAEAEAECSVALMMGLPIRLIFKAVNKRADPGRSKRREANWLPAKNLVWDGVGFDRPRLLSHVGQQPGRSSVWKTTVWRNIAAALRALIAPSGMAAALCWLPAQAVTFSTCAWRVYKKSMTALR